MQNRSENSSGPEWSLLLHRAIIGGYLSLLCSSFFLYMSIGDTSVGAPLNLTTAAAIWMMLARMAGLSAFCIGALALFNQRWTHGSILFIGSIGLPLLSLLSYGIM